MLNMDVLLDTEQDLEESMERAWHGDLLLIDIPLAYPERVRNAIIAFVHTHGKGAFRDLAYQFPLTFARWLVDESVNVYDSGKLWPDIAAVLGTSELWMNECGKAFYEVAQRYRLRIREDGKQYMATIVMHAAVPVRDLPDLFELVKEVTNHGPRGSHNMQILEDVRALPTLVYQTSPIRRFLTEAPDIFVAKYLDEMVDIVSGGLHAGHRLSLQQGYRLWKTESKFNRVKTGTRHRQKPFLRLGLEPDDVSPVVLVIPECMTNITACPWRMRTNLGVARDLGIRGEVRHDGRYHHASQFVNIPEMYESLTIWYEDQVVLDHRVTDPVWVFEEDTELRGSGWLSQGGRYYLLLAPGAHVMTRDVVRSEELPYFGNWSGYSIVEVEALGNAIEWGGGGRYGWIPVVGPPMVAHHARIEPNDTPSVWVTAFPVGIDADPRPFVVTNGTNGDEIELSPKEVLCKETQVQLDVSRIVPSYGSHVLQIRGPFGTKGTVQVDFGPRILCHVPKSLRWPDPDQGQHRLGTVEIDCPPDVSISSDGHGLLDRRDDGRSRFWVSTEDSRLLLEVSYKGSHYRQTFSLRDLFWEWTSSDHPGVINGPLRATWEQFLSSNWSLMWHGRDGLSLELQLCEGSNTLKSMGLVRANQPQMVKDAIRDDMVRASGDELRLVARVTDGDNVLGTFPMAIVHRPQFSEMTLQTRGHQLVLKWRGRPIQNLLGEVKSVVAQFGSIPLANGRLRHYGEWNEVVLENPGYQGPAMVRINEESSQAGRYPQRLWHPIRIPLGRFQSSPLALALDQWIAEGASAPEPKRQDDYRAWVECLSFVSPGDGARAVAEVVLPSLRHAAAVWLSAALLSVDTQKILFRLGVAQWNIGEVGSRQMPQFTKAFAPLRGADPILAWLLMNAWQESDTGLVEQLWGAKYRLLADVIGRGEFTRDDRRLLLDAMKSPLRFAPWGDSMDAPMSGVDQEWIWKQLHSMGKTRPLLREMNAWMRHTLSTAEASVGAIALAQRLFAHGISGGDGVRLLHMQQNLPESWHGLHSRELLRGELVASLLDYIDQRREK